MWARAPLVNDRFWKQKLIAFIIKKNKYNISSRTEVMTINVNPLILMIFHRKRISFPHQYHFYDVRAVQNFTYFLICYPTLWESACLGFSASTIFYRCFQTKMFIYLFLSKIFAKKCKKIIIIFICKKQFFWRFLKVEKSIFLPWNGMFWDIKKIIFMFFFIIETIFILIVRRMTTHTHTHTSPP